MAAIAGCTNLDGSPNRTATGGLIGAGAGALVGRAIDGGGTAGTVVGGALGSIAGAAIGATLDRQQRELEQGLGGSGATVVNTGNQLVVTLPEAITFDVDSAIVHPDYVDEIALHRPQPARQPELDGAGDRPHRQHRLDRPQPGA